MQHSIFYEFCRNSGFKVFTSESSDWYMIQPGMLMSIPYHHLINPSQEELDQLLKESGAWALRFPTSIENFGFLSKLEICDHFGYDINFLKHGPRNRVKGGFENCEIRQVSIDALKSDGFKLNLRTLKRQNRNDPKGNQKYWMRICDGLSQTNGAKIFGAYYKDHLAAYIVILELPTIAEMVIQNSDTEFLIYNPNNLLTYHVAWHYLTERANPVPICYGLGSLEDTPSLDHYKTGMGFEMRPIKQRLYFRKGLRFFLRPSLLHLLEFINRYITRKKNYKIDKSCALLKRYLEQE